MQDVTKTCYCHFLLSHSLKTFHESIAPCFQELGPRSINLKYYYVAIIMEFYSRTEWLKSQFPDGGRLGANPKIISEYMWRKFKHELEGAKIELVALNVSLIDEIWPKHERPKKRSKDAFVLDVEYTGTTVLQGRDAT